MENPISQLISPDPRVPSGQPDSSVSIAESPDASMLPKELQSESSDGTQNFDCVVIGAGSAGFAAARPLAKAGWKVAIIEGAREVGGLCILKGCMPTKALLHAAELRHGIEAAKEWGIEAREVHVNLKRLFQRKDELIQDFAGYRREQLETGPFTFLRGHAQFLDPFTLQLNGDRRIRSKHFIVATGSVIAPLPLPELDALNCLNSDTALSLQQLPETMIVLGAGAVALEFAQFFSRLGVKITILQRSNQLTSGFDPDTARDLEKALRREGIRVLTNTQILGAEKSNGKKRIRFAQGDAEEELVADEVFHGLGRRPNTSSLALGQAGVDCRASGQIIIHPTQQTTAPHIYAAGDCCGPHEIVHVAIQQGELAAYNLLNPNRAKERDDRLLTRVIFTDPTVAVVGLTEQEATKAGLPFLTASHPFNDHGKSMILGYQEGFVKILAHQETGEILGAACVGPQAGELIHEIVVAMAARMTVQTFAAIPHYHPTLAEIWLYPAEELADRL